MDWALSSLQAARRRCATIQPMTPAPTAPPYVQQKGPAPGSSTHYALLFLPPAKHSAAAALYALCHEIGSVAHAVSDPQLAHAKLAWWQTEVAHAWQGQPSHPLLKALMPSVTQFRIEQGQLQALVEAGQMDLAQNRYLDFAALQRYTQLSGGAATQAMARLCGQTDNATSTWAQHLGQALKLTHLIRDVGAHARQGRIYLPVNELQQFDVKAHEILKREPSERFTALMAFQAQRAHRLFDEALALLPSADRRAQKPGLILARINRSLLHEIEASQFAVLHQRLALTPLRKLWLAWQVQALGRLG